ncbi:MAG: Ig-like domain-containing protein, partial [Treponema sp.]|nr:Ig-like domain-containing protein [Treponema sp.]
MKRQAIVLAVVFSAFLFASCEDAVSDGPGNPSTVSVAVTGVTLDRENLTLMPGSKKTLSVTVEPEDAANTAVTWESDDEDVAVVDENGGVTGIAEGTAVITVATVDGGFTAVCVVTVDPTIISVTGVSIGTAALHSDDGGLWIKEGEIAVLTAAVSPPEASNEAVIWESSNPETAEVGESNGNIIGVAAGSTTITVTTADGGFTDTCVVTVKPRVTGVTLDHGSITLAPEESKPLAATVAPEGAPNRSVTWESDKTAVATVDEYGTVTGVAVGKAKVTVTTADGGFTDRCEVTVTGVSLDYDHVAIAKGATTTLTATVLPEDAADKSVTWSSNKEDVATVDGNGMVTGVGAGSATITATMTASGYTAECVVEVYEDHVYAVNGTETWDNALAAISEAADGSENSPRVFVLQVTGDFGVRGVSISDSSITGTY